jgi:hypothetical protein
MGVFPRKIERCLLSMSLLALCALSVSGQQTQGMLRARVVDSLGGLIVGATATLTDAGGAEKVATTSGEGVFVFSGLTPGRYTLRVSAPGFALYESAEVDVSTAQRDTLEITLGVEEKKEEIEVGAGTQISTNPDENASGTVLRGSDLDILSDDPDQLAADLDALAGAPDGPNGTQLLVDGFSRGRVPPKSSIREIRFNSNPFAAEQDSFGFGRVEIFTKPGSSDFHGQGFFNFNDESLNGRNPFATTRAAFQSRLYGGNLSGPLIAKKASFFLDFEQRRIDENAFINATTLDPALNIVPFIQTVITPQRRTNFSARLDFQLNTNHTLIARYNYLRFGFENSGLNAFTLPTRAFDRTGDEHTFQLTETAVLSPKMINELRFQYIRNNTRQEGDNTLPAINVQDAFIGGGSPFGLNSVETERYELSDSITRASGKHTIKAGGRLRRVHISDIDSSNFAGTFVFSSLEQYRQVLLGVPGVRPAQFTLAGGEQLASIGQWDFGLFAQDDWRVTPTFMLSAGLRYEKQTNINDGLNFGPRVSFAWSPFGAPSKQPKTVIRGGAGIFFGRVEENLTLLATRFNGLSQQQFIVRDPNFYPRIPTVAELAGTAQRQTIRRLVGDAKMPNTVRLAISVERELPYATKLSVNYIYRVDRNYPRSRNINAPLPGTFDPDIPDSGLRPFGDIGNIFEFETTGNSLKHTLLINVNSRPTKKLTIFGRFVLSKEQGDNEDAFTFPANSYDVRADYGALSFDIRANANIGVNYNGPWGLAFNTSVRASAANKFNITIGRDINGDAVFTDRPTLATDLSRSSVIVTPFGAFDTDPEPGQQIIAPFTGKGPAFFLVNQRVAKTINFGGGGGSAAKSSQDPGRYSLTLAVQVLNLLNHTNRGPVIGNLSSPLFGLSNTSASPPRRIDFQLRFNF